MFTVAMPRNPQNEWVYAPAASRKREAVPVRLLWMRSLFSQLLMVSVGVSKLGQTDLSFVQHGVKINVLLRCAAVSLPNQNSQGQ